MIDIRKHLPSIHSYEKKTTRYILPDENSSEGQFVPDIVLRTSEVAMSEKRRITRE